MLCDTTPFTLPFSRLFFWATVAHGPWPVFVPFVYFLAHVEVLYALLLEANARSISVAHPSYSCAQIFSQFPPFDDDHRRMEGKKIT